MSTENTALNPQEENNSLDSGTPFNSVKVVAQDDEYIRVFKAGEQPTPTPDTQLPNLGVESQEEFERDPDAGLDDQQQEGDDPINTDVQPGAEDSEEPTL